MGWFILECLVYQSNRECTGEGGFFPPPVLGAWVSVGTVLCFSDVVQYTRTLWKDGDDIRMGT